MRPFAPVFVVFGLLLGRILFAALAGYSRALTASRGPHPVHIGWLVPQLGLVVVLEGWTFWLLAWNTREQVVANYPTLIDVLIVVGGRDRGDLDLSRRDRGPARSPCLVPARGRLVLGGLLGANVANWVARIVLVR